MYEFHGWFGLAESTSEADSGDLAKAIDDLGPFLSWFAPPLTVAELRPLNGQYFLWINGLLNRPRDAESVIEDLLGFIAKRLPGSWGLVYD